MHNLDKQKTAQICKTLCASYKDMKLILIFIFLTTKLFSQINFELATIIDSMATKDQFYGGVVRRVENKELDSIKIDDALKLRQKCFLDNYFLAKQILSKYGYPDILRVGNRASFNYWLIVQHMDEYKEFQKQILDSMTTRLAQNLVNKQNWAYLYDRVKINYNELQLYGTQTMLNKDSTSYIIKPTIDTENLDKRRVSIGLWPIAEYIDIMNKRYFGNIKK
jgi:hypothetical protein